ncbi:MAG: hypothetical protein ABIJ00_16005 [Candidatus Eisenbacteria bacterium]
MKRSIVLSSIICFALAGSAFAADTETQALTMNVSPAVVLDVTSAAITLEIVAPGSGGADPADDIDNSSYAQYTSILNSGTTRSLTAAWGGVDAAPAGCSLKLEVTSLTSGCGSAVAGGITMTASAQNIVTSIGSCATGTGATDGAQLAYTLSVDTVASLDASDDQSATVTLTLTDAS